VSRGPWAETENICTIPSANTQRRGRHSRENRSSSVQILPTRRVKASPNDHARSAKEEKKLAQGLHNGEQTNLTVHVRVGTRAEETKDRDTIAGHRVLGRSVPPAGPSVGNVPVKEGESPSDSDKKIYGEIRVLATPKGARPAMKKKKAREVD